MEQQTYLDANHLSNVNIGDKMLRRDGNGGEKDTWEEFTVNSTYYELMKEFTNDYRHLNGSKIVLIPII